MSRSYQLILGGVLTFLASAVAFLGLYPDAQKRVEGIFYDLRISTSIEKNYDNRIVIIDIDEASIEAIGHWPWPRDQVADLLRAMHENYGVAVSAVDILFSEPDDRISLSHLDSGAKVEQLVSPDSQLAEVLANHSIVLSSAMHPFDETLRKGELGPSLKFTQPLPDNAPVPQAKGYLGVLPQFVSATPIGFFDNPLVDADGVYRRVPLIQELGGEYFPSLVLAVWKELTFADAINPVLEPAGDQQVLTGLEMGGVSIPTLPNGSVQIRFGAVGQEHFSYVSAKDVLSGNAPADLLAGRIALVGTSAVGLNDIRVTPVAAGMPGVEVHAHLLASILNQNFLISPDFSRVLDAAQILVVGLILSFLLPRFGALFGAIFAVLSLTGITWLNFYLFATKGWIIPLVGVITNAILVFGLLQVVAYFFENRSRRKLAATFSQYVPPEIAKEIANKGINAELEGESREMTVMFTDIRNFTTIAEKLDSKEVTNLLNIVLSHFTEIILGHRGTVDKYIGDCIMAFWGAPIHDAKHATHALSASLEMQSHLESLNSSLTSEGLPTIEIGIGIATGEMSVGNMGSDFRMAYTVVGDTVNLAARLESQTKEYNLPIIVSSQTANSCDLDRMIRIDRIKVKGRDQSEDIFAPLGLDALSLSTQEIVDYNAAMDAYLSQNWERASELFANVNHPLAAFHKERITKIQMRSYDPEWDGVYKSRQGLNSKRVERRLK